MNNNILVLGATGKTGRRVVQKLEQKGIENIRMGSRKATIPFDWEDPTTWKQALEGIDKVYLTFQPDLAVPMAKKVISDFTETATKSGVSKLVLLSGRGEKEAQECEQIVIRSGIDWTIVRADWFNQNFSESFFLEPILAGHVALPQADTLIPFVDAEDVADVAVAALLSDEHSGKIHELTGPRLLTFKDAINEIARASNQKIQFESISLDTYMAMLKSHQVPEDFIWLVNYLFSKVLDGRNAYTTDGVEKALGRKAKDFTAYANDAVKSAIWMASV